MKLKISLVSLLLTFFMVTFAQENVVTYTETAGYKNAFKISSRGSNWFIQLGAGAQYLWAEEQEKTGFLIDNVSLLPTFAVGKWFKPWFAIRLKAEGGLPLYSSPNVHEFDKSQKSGYWTQKDTYYNGHFDLMWNMCQFYGKYNAKRFFHFIPYLGLGVYYREKSDQMIPPSTQGTIRPYRELTNVKKPDGTLYQLGDKGVHQIGGKLYNNRRAINEDFAPAEFGPTLNGGLLFQFRLANRVALHVDFAVMGHDDEFNRIHIQRRYQFLTSATAGLTIGLGKWYFEPCQATTDYALIDQLNKKINDLRAENDLLSKRPDGCYPCPCPEAKPAPPVETKAYFLSNVFFRLNKYVIDANQQINVFNTAQFIKNTGQKVRVVGYADVKTGNAKINIKLGEQRAKAVARELTTKYGISSDMLIVEWKGDTEQPMAVNELNRVVIMTAQ